MINEIVTPHAKIAIMGGAPTLPPFDSTQAARRKATSEETPMQDTAVRTMMAARL